MEKNYPYDFGIVSGNINTLRAGARLLHGMGVNFGVNRPMFDQGKPLSHIATETCKGLHVTNHKMAFFSTDVKKFGPYRCGFFNLDDPMGFTAFVTTANEWATKNTEAVEAKPQSWSIRDAGGTEGWKATADKSRKVIKAGCVEVPLDIITQMIATLQNPHSWTLKDNTGHDSGRAVADPVNQRMMVRGNYPVTLATLKEMQKALT